MDFVKYANDLNRARTIAFLGTMYAGKTSILIEEARNFKRVYLCDAKNTRNSSRDLIFAIKQDEKSNGFGRELIVIEPKELVNVEANDRQSVVLIDEVHLYTEQELLPYLSILMNMTRPKTLDEINKKTSVFMAGLWLDFYSTPAYQVFPIWERVLPFIQYVQYLPSLNPCKLCGSNDEVNYTAPISIQTSKVGDHYMNLCVNCVKEYKPVSKAI